MQEHFATAEGAEAGGDDDDLDGEEADEEDDAFDPGATDAEVLEDFVQVGDGAVRRVAPGMVTTTEKIRDETRAAGGARRRRRATRRREARRDGGRAFEGGVSACDARAPCEAHAARRAIRFPSTSANHAFSRARG